MKVCPSCQRSFPPTLDCCPDDGSWLQPSARPPDPGDRFLGRILSRRYRLDQRLGSGSVGVVFRGLDLLLNRQIAVKLLMPRGFMEPRAARRLKREFRALSRLDNPHIVKAYELSATEEQIPFLVMEYVEGYDLGQLLDRVHHLEPARALRLAAQILDALQNAHSQGIIHRDLKADNVHLTQMHGVPDFVKVLDFGLVKFYDISDRQHATSLTAAHLVVGTPHYMAPEQIRGGDLGPWTDLYALGILLYRMLTGALPFPGTEPIQVMRAHCHQLATPPSMLQPAIPRELEALVLDLLEKDANRRPASAAGVLARLYSGELDLLWQQPIEPSYWAVPAGEPPPRGGSSLPWSRLLGPATGTGRMLPATLPNAPVLPSAAGSFSGLPTNPLLLQARTSPRLPPAPRPPLPPPGSAEPSYLWLVLLSWGVALLTAFVVVAILA
ncbi:MAG: serine/threonine protein kinase [Deltaproteobacteria bacterium]|nr:serine/threonine protein kinase [Deltaproteobacteria bacterium]